MECGEKGIACNYLETTKGNAEGKGRKRGSNEED